jgi:hypothetical protein
VIDLHPTFPAPVDDPMPDLTERFRRAGAFDRDPTSGRLTDDAVAAIRGTLQSIVTGLQSDALPFRAVFGKYSTAATDMTARIVKIGTAFMDDLTITDGQLASAMTGLAYHEVAHINEDRIFDEVTLEVARSGHPLGGLAIDIGNIAMDGRIETIQRRRMPGYADCLDVAMYFISGEVLLPTAPPPVGLSKGAARTMYFVAVRTPWGFADWTTAPDVRAWGQGFAERFNDTHDPEGIRTLLVEALDMMQSWMPDPTAPLPPVEEPPGPVCPPVGPPPEEEPPTEEPPEGPGGDDPTEDPEGDDEEPPDGPGGDDGDDDEPPVEEPPKGEKRGTNADDKPPTEDEPPVDDGGDPTDEPPGKFTDGKPSDEPTDTDSSDDWGPETGEFTSPSSTAPQVTEGVESNKALEDIALPACAGDAATTATDYLYDATATRVGKSREESNVRIVKSPGWPDRKVRRTRDWNGTRLS